MNAMRNLATATACREIIPYPSDRVERRVVSVAESIAHSVKTEALQGGGLLANTIVLPDAGIVLAGTSCDRPMLLTECQEIARHTGMDVVLLRLNALQGVSFDVVLSQPIEDLLHRHLRVDDGELWLIPDRTCGRHLRLTARGLTAQCRSSCSNVEDSDDRLTGAIGSRTLVGGA